MKPDSFAPQFRLCAIALALPFIVGCNALRSTAAPQPAFHMLDGARTVQPAVAVAATASSATAPTMMVNPPHAAPGFDGQRIIYVRTPHKLEYFAHNEWVDTPARMLAPLIAVALSDGGAFRAVVLTPSAASGELRLDTDLIRLQQEFGSQPSRVRFTLRATNIDNATRQVVAWREFDETVAAASEDPASGVAAANRAVQAVVERLAAFCAEAAMNWTARAANVSGTSRQ